MEPVIAQDTEAERARALWAELEATALRAGFRIVTQLQLDHNHMLRPVVALEAIETNGKESHERHAS